MSENNFVVPAKKPAEKKSTPKASTAKKPSSTTGKKPASAKKPSTPKDKKPSSTGAKKTTPKPKASTSKLESARVKPSPEAKAKRQLPDVPDMGNMTREERIEAVMGIKKEKPKAKEVSPDKAADNRYASMKSQIARTQSTKEEAKVEGQPARKDLSPLITRVALITLALVLVLIVILLLQRRRTSPASVVPTAVVEAPATAQTEKIVSELVTIQAGMGARQAAALFSSVVDSNELLAFLEEAGLLSSIQAGSYEVDGSMGVEEIARLITKREASSTLIIYPGYTIEDIDRLLANRSLIDSGDFTQAAEGLAADCGLAFAEGYLLAGTYSFTDCYSLASSMLSATLSLFKEEGEALMESGLSIQDVVRIASMVNRETQDSAQMPTIARVILNRLAVDMPLGIDATTRYELDNWTDPIPQAVYEEITPYNTRRKAGLPPSGIGCPGRDAILSVLHPAETEDLFYLHSSDGRLYTSPDYDSHLETYERLH